MHDVFSLSRRGLSLHAESVPVYRRRHLLRKEASVCKEMVPSRREGLFMDGGLITERGLLPYEQAPCIKKASLHGKKLLFRMGLLLINKSILLKKEVLSVGRGLDLSIDSFLLQRKYRFSEDETLSMKAESTFIRKMCPSLQECLIS